MKLLFSIVNDLLLIVFAEFLAKTILEKPPSLRNFFLRLHIQSIQPPSSVFQIFQLALELDVLGWVPYSIEEVMVLQKMENKGQTINRPPLFKGIKFDNWKQRMIAFFKSYHIDMLEVVENGNYILMITIIMSFQDKDGLMNKSRDTSWTQKQETTSFMHY